MDFKKIQKQLPPTIPGHYGQLTIMKHKSGNYYAMYPQVIELKVSVMKGKSIEAVCKKMHSALINVGILEKQIKKKKKKIGKKRGPMNNKQKLNYKLTRQKTTLKNK